MEFLRIKKAVENYNKDYRDEGEALLTQGKLAAIVMPELNDKLAGQYISSWIHGKRLGALKPHHINSICEVTNVDANFLFGIEPHGDSHKLLAEVYDAINIADANIDLAKRVRIYLSNSQ